MEQLSDTNIEEPADIDELDSISIPDYGPELGFDEEELSLRPYDLYRLLRRQIHWAEKESAQLRQDWEKIEPRRKQAFREKESIFDNVAEAELELIKTIWGTEGVLPQALTLANGLGQLQQKNDVPQSEDPAETASAPTAEPVAG